MDEIEVVLDDDALGIKVIANMSTKDVLIGFLDEEGYYMTKIVDAKTLMFLAGRLIEAARLIV